MGAEWLWNSELPGSLGKVGSGRALRPFSISEKPQNLVASHSGNLGSSVKIGHTHCGQKSAWIPRRGALHMFQVKERQRILQKAKMFPLVEPLGIGGKKKQLQLSINM